MLASAALLAGVIAVIGCARGSQPRPAEPVRVDYDTAGAPRRLPSSSPETPFFPDAAYDPAVTLPETCLGHALGVRLAASDAIVRCFRLWAEESPRATMATYATSYEGRELVRVVISSPDNLARLDDILADLARLADPRGLPRADARRIAAQTPAVAWLGYSIHGDEVSGADASLAVGHHIIADQGEDTRTLLDRLVIVIDPVMNPDGRARILSQVEQNRSLVPNLDDMGMHRGYWPWGRGNHYLFDMNRDWFVGVAPETRGRWQEMLRFHPQLVVDAHEMGSQDTYLFYPYADPINPHLAPTLARWHQVLAEDQSRAFDAHGWAYYTREWADGWYPGYTDAWAGLTGAVGMLYEQASTKGQPLLRRSGQQVTYRETVHAQAVSSMSNLHTLARNREPMLRDYLAYRRLQLQPDAAARTFVLRPGRTPDRERALVTLLLRQGVEVYRADAGFTGRNAESSQGVRSARVDLPAGAYLVPAAQPRGALVRSILAFDLRFNKDSLQRERESLEREGESRIYDITAWNLGQAFALDAYWIDGPQVARTQVTGVTGVTEMTQAVETAPRPAGAAGLGGGQELAKKPNDEPRKEPEDEPARGTDSPYAWVVDGRDDASATFAVQALARGLTVHVADESFDTAGRSFVRGSVLVRAGDNVRRGEAPWPETASGEAAGQPAMETVAEVEARLRQAADAAGVQLVATTTGRSNTDGPDLGGQHFRLLHRPRVAVLSNAPVDPESFGHIWHQLDRRLLLPISMIDAQHLGSYDLRRYNVLIIPPAGPGLATLLAPYADQLAAWVRSGGTLIAVAESATVLAQKDLPLSQVRLRRDVLDELALYRDAARRDLATRAVGVDEAAVWDGPVASTGEQAAAANDDGRYGEGEEVGEDEGDGGVPADQELAAQQDAWRRRFSPMGAMLRGLVSHAAWLSFGVEAAELPVLVMGDHVLLARDPVQVPVRLAPAASLRLSGLLWPEARARLAESAYVTVEPLGNGQVILFASPPSFRGAFPGTARLLSNAVVYGPSLGAWQPSRW